MQATLSIGEIENYWMYGSVMEACIYIKFKYKVQIKVKKAKANSPHHTPRTGPKHYTPEKRLHTTVLCRIYGLTSHKENVCSLALQ